MFKTLIAAATAALLTTSAFAETQTAAPKELAINAFNALFWDYSEAGVREVFAEDIIQHNVLVPTGRDALLGLLPILEQFGSTYENHRLLQDGDFAVMHNTVNNAQPFGAEQVVSFNVYRIENGQIAEHWGVPTPLLDDSQFDGPTEVTDLDRTNANKAAAAALFEALVNGTEDDVAAVVQATFEPDYRNHGVGVADGIAGLFEAFAREQWVYTKTHKILGEGNFVLAISEGTAKGAPRAFYDLLRFEDGRVVEHWDIIVPIPSEDLANDNGMFGGFNAN